MYIWYNFRYGTFYYVEFKYYEGEWYENKRNGWGRMYYLDGSVYEGRFAVSSLLLCTLALSSAVYLYISVAEYTRWALDRPPTPGQSHFFLTRMLQASARLLSSGGAQASPQIFVKFSPLNPENPTTHLDGQIFRLFTNFCLSRTH